MFTYALHRDEISTIDFIILGYVWLQLYNFIFTFSDTYSLIMADLCSRNM